MTTQQISFKITRQQSFNSSEIGGDALIALGGCSDNPNELGLGAWQYEFDVEVTKNEETKKFTVVYQPEERVCGMKNYSGCEVTTAGSYGCDYDESDELSEFCDYDNNVLDGLYDIAHKAAKEEFERLTA